MTVTLEELDSANSVIMNDSLITLANGISFVNVWTTMDIQPEHTYRLVAKRPDGATSSVIVTIPPPFPMPVVEYQWNDCRARLTVQDVQRLADVQWIWYYKINSSGNNTEKTFRLSRRKSADSLGPGRYSALIRPLKRDPAIVLSEGEVVEHRKTIFVAAGGPEWDDDIETLSDIEYTLQKTGSNIKNWVGYLIDIFSRRPLYQCDE
ncbi:hypothetical protein Asal01_00761 [Fodinibius salicampi]